MSHLDFERHLFLEFFKTWNKETFRIIFNDKFKLLQHIHYKLFPTKFYVEQINFFLKGSAAMKVCSV